MGKRKMKSKRKKFRGKRNVKIRQLFPLLCFSLYVSHVEVRHWLLFKLKFIFLGMTEKKQGKFSPETIDASSLTPLQMMWIQLQSPENTVFNTFELTGFFQYSVRQGSSFIFVCSYPVFPTPFIKKIIVSHRIFHYIIIPLQQFPLYFQR